MGKILTQLRVENALDTKSFMDVTPMVDTGAAYLTLPSVWKDRFGSFEYEEKVELATATQETVIGELCGPVRIRIQKFRPIYTEVLFIDMHPEEGEYEPLLGYTPLELAGAAVDMLSHRLIPVKYYDLK